MKYIQYKNRLVEMTPAQMTLIDNHKCKWPSDPWGKPLSG